MLRQFYLMSGLVGLMCEFACADDWPAWRHDAERSAVTRESLPAKMFPVWSRSLHPNQVAWPEDPRLQFDASYEPIVAGKRLIVASSKTNSVTAFDTDSGDQLWRYLTEAPVRLAPFAHRGRIYFGADDGCLRCLDLADGREIWKVQAAPTNRLVLGNSRMVSSWPARGGVVIADDKAYFTIGVWPFEGCMLCKVNIDGATPVLRTQMLEDVSPQGHLSMSGDYIYIPTGRGPALCFDAKKFQPVALAYTATGSTTESHVASPAGTLLHGDAVYQEDIRQQVDCRLLRPIVDQKIIYGMRTTKVTDEKGANRIVYELAAYDLSNRQVVTGTDRRGNATKKYQFPQLSAVDTSIVEPDPANTPRLFVKAGHTLIGGKGRTLFAIDTSNSQASLQVTWQRELSSKPTTAMVADGKLFVVTERGDLHCFGGQETTLREHPLASVAVPEKPEAAKLASSILTRGAVDRGYCLFVGGESKDAIIEILRQTQLQMVIIEPNMDSAAILRRELDRLDLHGTRATVLDTSPENVELPPYLFRLIHVSKRFSTMDQLPRTLFASLRPYGGVMMLHDPVASTPTTKLKDSLAGVAQMKIQQEGEWLIAKRVGALPGAADWTHEYGDPANTLMSADQLVKAPLGILWYGGPSSSGELFFNRHYWGPGLTVVDGRMVIQGPHKLTSVDIYTGEILWQTAIRDGSGPGREGNFFEVANPGFHFVAAPDFVYLVYDDQCVLLNSETGQVQKVFRLLDEKDRWGKIRLWKDQLIVTVFQQTDRGLMPRAVQAMNRFTGELQWRHDARSSIPVLAVGGDCVFFMDGHLEGFYDAWKRRGLTPKSEGHRTLHSLDIATGKQHWERSSDRIATWMAYSPEHDVLVSSNKEGLDAFNGKDGDGLWKKDDAAPGFGGHPEHVWDKVILAGDAIIDQRGPGKSYDVRTGKVKLSVNPLTLETEDWQFTKTGHHCNYAIASPHLLTFRASTAGFFDRQTNTTGRLNGFRSGCRNSLIPAGGVLNAPNFAHGCSCDFNLFTSLALIHRPANDLWTYSAVATPGRRPKKLGINFGAPGDRIAEDGTMWVEYPANRDPSPVFKIETEGEIRPFRIPSSHAIGKDSWIAASGIEGVRKIKLTLPADSSGPQPYDVQLYFLDPFSTAAGQRQFDVSVQGTKLATGLDIVRQANGTSRVVIRELKQVVIGESLTIELSPQVGDTLIGGIRLVQHAN